MMVMGDSIFVGGNNFFNVISIDIVCCPCHKTMMQLWTAASKPQEKFFPQFASQLLFFMSDNIGESKNATEEEAETYYLVVV